MLGAAAPEKALSLALFMERSHAGCVAPLAQGKKRMSLFDVRAPGQTAVFFLRIRQDARE